jgi:uncharacterized protein (TIGR00725 family)
MTLNYVAISGPGADATADDTARAYEAASQLASAGVVLLTGGLAGVMGAAAAGAKAAGGTSIGLLPGFDRAQAHGDLSFSIPTGLGELRNGLLVRSADAVLVIGGSWGTMSELALAQRTDVPVVTLGGWSIDSLASPKPAIAESVAEAVQLVLGSIG